MEPESTTAGVAISHDLVTWKKRGPIFEKPYTGTVFMEGLAYFKKQWFLYYDCVYSRVVVAVYDPAKPAMPDPLL